MTRILHFNFSPLHCTATSVQSPLQLSFAFEKLAKQLRCVKRCLIVSNIARYFASSIRELMQRVTSLKPGMSPSRFCNYFSTIPSCLAREMCTNYLGIKLLWRLGEKLYKFIVKSSRRPYSGEKKTRPFHVVERTRTVAKCTKISNRPCRACKNYCFS